MNERDLIKTLDFQLEVESGNKAALERATFESRSVYNETIRLAKEGVSRDEIPRRVSNDANLVKNTAQRIVAKSFDALDNCRSRDGASLPSHEKEEPYPLRANYGEGYDLTDEDGSVRFRISTEPYEHVTGVLKGDEAHLDVLRSAINGDEWKIGTAEALFRGDDPELHISVTKNDHRIRSPENSCTVIGVDVNESNVALSAISESGIEATQVIAFPEIKFERHRLFVIRKRVQSAGKKSVHETLRNREKQFVRDRLHKVSRHIVDWSQQFEKPCIVFEDLKEMRDSIDYGARMNRRLHHLPFRTLQFYTSYKASSERIPTTWIDPEYTSQACALTACEYVSRANRNKARFNCRSCGHQNHADRNASVNVAKKGMKKLSWTVPALKTLPQVRKVRRQASGAVDAPTVARSTDDPSVSAGVLD